jgi:hypothetical protein
MRPIAHVLAACSLLSAVGRYGLAAWPMADLPVQAAPTRAHDALSIVVTVHWVAMAARLPASSRAMRRGPAVAQEPVWHGGGTGQVLWWRGSPDQSGDVEAEEKLRPDGAPMTTVASGGRQRPRGDPTTSRE